MSRLFSPVTAAAIASFLAMAGFVLWIEAMGVQSPCGAKGCAPETAMRLVSDGQRSLGLIDL